MAVQSVFSVDFIYKTDACLWMIIHFYLCISVDICNWTFSPSFTEGQRKEAVKMTVKTMKNNLVTLSGKEALPWSMWTKCDQNVNKHCTIRSDLPAFLDSPSRLLSLQRLNGRPQLLSDPFQDLLWSSFQSLFSDLFSFCDFKRFKLSRVLESD